LKVYHEERNSSPLNYKQSEGVEAELKVSVSQMPGAEERE
jgi:hypothetical protein